MNGSPQPLSTPTLQEMQISGPMLKRGFWLYIWRVDTPRGEVLYVGRTGDNSSPKANAPYTRMGQHLGRNRNQNALRSRLESRGIVPEECSTFQLFAYGPVFPEVEWSEGANRETTMDQHIPFRNVVGALEKRLADELRRVGYDVLNTVNWKHSDDGDRWEEVRHAFARHFPKLEAADSTETAA